MSLPNEEKELDQLEGVALRPSVSPIQNLLATELATATLSADVLQKIRHICEAYLMTGEQELGGFKLEEVKRILALDQAFINKVAYQGGLLAIPWPFQGGHAFEYLRPFCQDWYFTELSGVDYPKFYTGEQEEIRRYYHAFYDLTTRPCDPGNILMVQEYFKNWALPICVKLMTALFEKYISPETWEKTIANMRGRRTTHAGAGAEGFTD
jgi:hypothetical protein